MMFQNGLRFQCLQTFGFSAIMDYQIHLQLVIKSIYTTQKDNIHTHKSEEKSIYLYWYECRDDILSQQRKVFQESIKEKAIAIKNALCFVWMLSKRTWNDLSRNVYLSDIITTAWFNVNLKNITVHGNL